MGMKFQPDNASQELDGSSVPLYSNRLVVTATAKEVYLDFKFIFPSGSADVACLVMPAGSLAEVLEELQKIESKR